MLGRIQIKLGKTKEQLHLIIEALYSQTNMKRHRLPAFDEWRLLNSDVLK
jgi:hypothetical protein